MREYREAQRAEAAGCCCQETGTLFDLPARDASRWPAFLQHVADQRCFGLTRFTYTTVSARHLIYYRQRPSLDAEDISSPCLRLFYAAAIYHLPAIDAARAYAGLIIPARFIFTASF